MQALVLVGGEGTRLRPLTESVPKPVLPLVDRPFIVYLIDWLARHGVEEVVLACGFLPDALRAVLGDGEPGGPRLRYVAEPSPRGTAGAIKFAAEHLEERFLALNGDVLTDLDLTALVRAHTDRGARATLGLYLVDDASAYGVVRCDSRGEVLEFVEKPDSSRGATGGEINAGTYVLERSLLELVPSDRAVSIEREVFPRLIGEGLYGVRLEGYWMDIGTPERYLQASWDVLEGRVQSAVAPTAEGVFVAADAEVAGARVGPRAVIGPGCRVGRGATVRGSVLLDGCRVGDNAHIEAAILSPEVEVEAGARVEDAVVGQGARVGAR